MHTRPPKGELVCTFKLRLEEPKTYHERSESRASKSTWKALTPGIVAAFKISARTEQVSGRGKP